MSEDGSELVIPFNIVETMAVLTKCSFDESHRQPISNLGGIPAIADLIQVKIDRFHFMKQSSQIFYVGHRQVLILSHFEYCVTQTNTPSSLRNFT